jgi:hypothetical protein
MFKESKREYPDEGTVDDADRALERDGQTMQLRGEELEARKRFVETGQVRVGKDAPPILNIRVPHSGHSPSVAGRPFFIVIGLASFMSRCVLHFMQYAFVTAAGALAIPSLREI